MRERPIIFSEEMIRAIREDRKSQTRRVIKPQPELHNDCVGQYFMWKSAKYSIGRFLSQCPYGVTGDQLWVRETFASFSQRHLKDHDATYPIHTHCPHYPDVIAIYRESGADFPHHFHVDGYARWKPSIHMPHWASRIRLQITGHSVERVQDIREGDAVAEGVRQNWLGDDCPDEFADEWENYGADLDDFPCYSAKDSFRTLWDMINAERGFPWPDNPWVWVVEFEVVENGRKS
jgi:hypothetical protein